MAEGNFPTIRLAAAQLAPVFLDREATIDKACAAIEEAAANGADVVAFPEGFVPGHPVWYYHFPALSQRSRDYAERLFHNAVEVPSTATDRICDAARRNNVNVVLGLCQRQPGTSGTLWNSQMFVDRSGRIVGIHQKLIPTAAERVVHSPGSSTGMRTFSFDFGEVGGLICGENSNPLAINALILGQERVHVASWPNYFAPGWPPGMAETGVLTGRATAYMAKCYVINACGTMPPDVVSEMMAAGEDVKYLGDSATFGGSTIISPSGDVIAGPAGPGDEILYADADLELIVRSKQVHDLSGHYQRADVFKFGVTSSDPHAMPRYDVARRIAVPRDDSTESDPASARTPDGSAPTDEG